MSVISNIFNKFSRIFLDKNKSTEDLQELKNF